MNLIKTACHTPVGTVYLLSRDGGRTLCGLQFTDYTDGEQVDNAPVFIQTRQWLDAYFAATESAAQLPPLDLSGLTPMRRRLYEALMTIGRGTTITYAQLGQRIGCRSARAVGTAMAKNPLLLLIPCHRVIGSDGALHGYAAGLPLKHHLLTLESPAAISFAK